MRKHFLILMLLALLPLAGWAADYSTDAKVTVDDMYFGIAPTKADVDVVVNTVVQAAELYEIDATAGKVNYYTDQACTNKATLIGVTPAVGTYYLKIKAATSANSNWTYGKIIIKKMPLTVTMTNGAGKGSKQFNNKGIEDEAEAALYGTVSAISQLKWNGSHTDYEAASITGDALTALTATMTVSRAAGKAVKADYAYTVSTSNGNYEVKTVTGAVFAITTRDFPATRGTTGLTYSVTVSNNEVTYDGTNKGVTLTVVDNDMNYTLTSADMDIKYDGSATVQNYKEGGYVISFTTKGNYNPVTVTLNEEGDKKLVIKKRDMWVFVNDAEKVYNGVAFDKTYAASKVSFSDMKGLTKADVTGVTIKYDVAAYNTDAPTEAGEYYMVPVVAEGAGSNLNLNHNVNILNTGKWTIKKRPIDITAKDYTNTFGKNAPAFAANDTYVQLEAKGVDRGMVNADGDGGYATEKALLLAALDVQLNGEYTAVGTYEDAIVVSVKAAKAATVKNYDINPVAGTYKIDAAAYTIIVKEKTITYGTPYTMADFAYTTNGAAVAEGQTVEFEVWSGSKKLDELPTDAGVYDLKIKQNDAYLPAGYELPITYISNTFTIEKKAVTAKLDDQILMINDTKAALLASKVSFVGADDKNALVGEDKIKFDLDFNTDGAEGLDDGTEVRTQADADIHNDGLTGALRWYYNTWAVDGHLSADDVTAYNAAINPTPAVTTATAITAAMIQAAKDYNETLENAWHRSLLTEGTFNEGVKISNVPVTADGFANKNYAITYVAVRGKLLVLTNTALVLQSDNADLANVEKLDNANVPVRLDLSKRNTQELPAGTAREWAAKQWNTLVLPFDIEVAELSQCFGYAIVNLVDPTKTTENNVQFKLWMDKIPANTPFAIKTAKPLKGATLDVAITTTGIINFGTQTVKKPTETQKAGVDAGKGYKFVPCYELLTVDNTKTALRFLLGNNANWAKIGASSSNKWNIIPFAAYVDLSASSAPEHVTFTFEEIDGSTTTIKAIESGLIDGSVKGYTMEGWYNLNGVKLEGVPTQKGIYINNGKKVVIK